MHNLQKSVLLNRAKSSSQEERELGETKRIFGLFYIRNRVKE